MAAQVATEVPPSHKRVHSLDKFSALAAFSSDSIQNGDAKTVAQNSSEKQEYFAFSKFEAAINTYKQESQQRKLEPLVPNDTQQHSASSPASPAAAGLPNLNDSKSSPPPQRQSLIGDTSLRQALNTRYSIQKVPSASDIPHSKAKEAPSANGTAVKSKKKRKKKRGRRTMVAYELGNLLDKFKEEARNEDALLSILEESAQSNPEFGIESNCREWTVHEVCYWVIKIGMDDYIFHFYNAKIDGKLLLSYDLTLNSLIRELHVKKIHASKIFKEINRLRNLYLPQEMVADTSTKEMAELQDEVIRLRAENHDLRHLVSMMKQHRASQPQSRDGSPTTAALRDTQQGTTDESSDGAGSEDASKYHMKIKMLRHELVAKDKAINILKDGLNKMKEQHITKMKEEKKKIRELENSYVKLETHYENILKNENIKKKTNGNVSENDVSMLWDENQELTQQLTEEKESKKMLEQSYKTLQLEIVREKRKCTLLENQASRLTEELTRYLLSAKHNVMGSTIEEEDETEYEGSHSEVSHSQHHTSHHSSRISSTFNVAKSATKSVTNKVRGLFGSPSASASDISSPDAGAPSVPRRQSRVSIVWNKFKGSASATITGGVQSAHDKTPPPQSQKTQKQ